MGLPRRWSTPFGICTSMYSSGLFLISSGTIAWNMHDGEPTTCIKFVNLHKKSRQCLRQQICPKALIISIQLDPDHNQGRLGCVGKKWCDELGITNFHWPSVDGPHPLTFDPILSMKLKSSLFLNNMMTTAPTVNKTPKGRIKCDSHHESESTLFAILLRFGAF